MKTLVTAITLILSQQVSASNSCFNNEILKDVVEASEEINECFAKDRNDCNLNKLSVELQREVNSKRLIPYDRTKSRLMNEATGVVTATFIGGETLEVSGQKISSCHIITSAHLLYNNSGISADSQDKLTAKDSESFKLNFHTGQTCESKLFESKVGAQVFFKMTSEVKDFRCKRSSNGNCSERVFYGKSDLIILKLESYSKNDNHFFKVRTDPIAVSQRGERVNCWGYPGFNNKIPLPKLLSDKLLWHQKDAKLFGGNTNRGIVTNAIAYSGMSGGGCVFPSNPSELVAIFASKNSASGHSGIFVNAKTPEISAANFLSPLDHLAARYLQATGKSLTDLDKECD